MSAIHVLRRGWLFCSPRAEKRDSITFLNKYLDLGLGTGFTLPSEDVMLWQATN